MSPPSKAQPDVNFGNTILIGQDKFGKVPLILDNLKRPDAAFQFCNKYMSSPIALLLKVISGHGFEPSGVPLN